MEELIPILEQLASELNTTVEFLWQILIKQANVFIIVYVCRIISVGILGFIFSKAVSVFTHWVEKDDESWQCITSFVVSGVCAVIIVVSVIIIIVDFSEFVTALMNPEYWALQQILERIGAN